MRRIVGIFIISAIFAGIGHAEIYNWQTGEVIPGTEDINPEPGLRLWDWNTESKNLNYADFSNSDLYIVDFSGSWLRNSLFTNSILKNCGFGDTDLTNANFTNADLRDSGFYNTNLTGANFNDAQIHGDIYQTEFSGVTDKGFTREQLYSTKSYKDKNLSNMYLTGNDFTGWNFEGQNMTGSALSYKSMIEDGSILNSANFKNANLETAYIENATAHNVNFQMANLKMASCSDTDFTGSDFRNATFDSTMFYNSNLTNVNFSGTVLVDTDFISAVLTNTDFTDADVRGTDFGRYYNYDQTGYFGTGISKGQLYSTKSYKEKDLSGIKLWYNDLTGFDFSGQNLTNAKFDRTIISDADFSNTTSKGFTFEQFRSTENYTSFDISGINLSNNDLSGWFLIGQNLTDVDFADSDVKGAEFGRYDFHFGHADGGTGISQQQLYSTKSYKEKDLSGISLLNDDYSGWNFEGQNLAGASFFNQSFRYLETYLIGTNFKNSNLTNVNFFQTYLTNADFTDAHIQGATFGRDLFINVGTELTVHQLCSTASFKNKDLSRLALPGHDLENLDFSGFNMTDAYFTDVSFYRSNLTDTRFGSAKLDGADFSLADLRGSDIASEYIEKYNGTIEADGTINGLQISDEMFTIRNYPKEIMIEFFMTTWQDSTLQFVFDENPWGSTINFNTSDIKLGGMLELSFADGVHLEDLVGTSFKIFNWDGRLTEGNFFDGIISEPWTQWDTQNLYTSGEVTLLSVPEPITLMLLSVGGCLVVRKRYF